MTEYYEIAEKVIRVESIHQMVHDLCRDYVTDRRDADIDVVMTEEDIMREKEKSEYDFSDAYYEELGVYRKICDVMPRYDTFLFHGSAIAVDGVAYIFTAKSGTGKSTHSKLWMDRLGDKAIMVNDDKPLIRVTDECTMVYGTPYNGKHRRGNNIHVPVKAICQLTRGETNEIKRISGGEIFPTLMVQAYRPADKEMYRKTLDLLAKMTKTVKFYRLACNMDPEAAVVSYNGMQE